MVFNKQLYCMPWDISNKKQDKDKAKHLKDALVGMA